MRKTILLLAVLLFVLSLAVSPVSAWFPIYDGETVVFLGDSITEQRLYTTFIEAYTIGRFPGWKIKFRNAGWSGDTAENALKRLDRDVFSIHPQMVMVAFGMNDGGTAAFDQAVCDSYLKNQQQLATALKEKGIQSTIFLGPGTVDPDRKVSLAAYPDTLKKMSDALAQVCKTSEHPFVDLWTPLDAALKDYKAKGKENTLIPDGIHPNPAGHLVMAFAALTTLDAPALVADVTITVPSLNARALNAQVREAEQVGTGVRMKVEEKALPMFVPDEARPAMELVPILSRLNREILTVSGLNAGSYDLKIDGKTVATFSESELAKGINLTLHQTPMWEQSRKLWELIVKKNDAYHKRWRDVQLFEAPDWMDAKTVADMRKSVIDKLDKEIADLEQQISETAKPVQHLFEVVPTTTPEPS